MPQSRRALHGVIAAVITPISEAGEPDPVRFLRAADHLLTHGCDGLNVLGTTGEATSFTLAHRSALMRAVAEANAPLGRMMVGTGAAAVGDAVALTRLAGELGFAGALLLPPFYYKGVGEGGVLRYFDHIVSASARSAVPLYLYNFPAQSGVPYTPRLVAGLRAEFGERIAGLKDSSGDLKYARAVAALDGNLDVFPSSEAVLLEARSGIFAGCISATANVNSDLCARAWTSGDAAALDVAVRIRKLFDGKPLVSGVKTLLAHILRDPALAEVLPPLERWSADNAAALVSAYEDAREAA